MKKIFKQKLKLLPGVQTFNLQPGAKVVEFAMQYGTPTFWYQFESEVEGNVNLSLAIVGTGWQYPDNYEHIKTIHHDGFVWHLMEVINHDPT